jgi:hypothetical protein
MGVLYPGRKRVPIRRLSLAGVMRKSPRGLRVHPTRENGGCGGGGRRWIRYRGSGLRFVSGFRGGNRFLFLHQNTGFPLSRE